MNIMIFLSLEVYAKVFTVLARTILLLDVRSFDIFLFILFFNLIKLIVIMIFKIK